MNYQLKKKTMDLKAKVLAFLRNQSKNKRTNYKDATDLLSQSGGRTPRTENFFRNGFTDSNLKSLLYELQKMHGITDVEVHRKERKAVADADEETNKEAIVGGKVVNAAADLNVVDPKGANDEDLANKADVSKVENESINKTNAQADEKMEKKADEKLSKDASAKKDLKDDSFKTDPGTEARKTLREDFPFLADKDCPDELKVLVADKMTLYKEYVKDHNDLQKHRNGELELSEQEVAALSKRSIENFEANRAIYDELNYYGEHKKILGKHPIFDKLNVETEVNAMTQEQLLAYVNSSKKYFSVKKSAITKAGDNKERVAELEAAVAERQSKLALVEKRLGLGVE